MDMPWPALRSLHDLARLGTIAAVAESRGYTAGAISQQLAVLERAVGQPLLTRVGRGVRLTDAGSVLARHAQRILDAEEDARRALEASTDEVAGTVRVASFATSAATLLAPSIAIAAERYPRLEVMTLEIDVDAVAAAVRRGDAELAFGLDYPDAPVPRAAGVELVRVTSERFALAVPAAWNLAGPISLGAAADHGWILPPEDTNYGRAIRAACRRADFEPHVTHLVTDTAVSLAMVGQGVGVTMVTPMMLALAPARGLQTVAITEDVLRHVVLIRRAADGERPTIRAVTTVIEGVVRRAAQPAGHRAAPFSRA